jgi:hypothetical protein
MITGCWRSSAFMEYIHKQIQEFIEGMSQRMILRQIYFAIPQVDNGLLPKEVDTIFDVKL